MKKKEKNSAGASALQIAVSTALVFIGTILLAVSFRAASPNADQAQDNQQVPDVVPMDGPVSQDRDLRDLPYIPAKEEEDEGPRHTRHPFPLVELQRGAASDVVQQTFAAAAAASIPSPLQTFAGMGSTEGCGSCLPPDTDGDIGPNHYMQSVNSSIRIHDKSGNVLAGPITYNSFFYPLGLSTPCGSAENDGDGVVFYDHIADRWIVSDFAFNGNTTTGAYYQCIGVSKTGDPVGGGWNLYAVQVDPAQPKFLGDYPKFGLWPDAYYMSVNLFDLSQPTASQFQGVRVYAFDRKAMINGGAANTIAFSILPADLGDQYSLVPATFRTGAPPPAGQPEWFMNINSSGAAGTIETQIFVRRFHVDFATPANSTFGVGASHSPDGIITVNGFVDAFTGTTTHIVPNGTATTTQFLDTLGDKLMYPLVYQNLNGVESIYADQTVNNNQGGTGPTAIRWYQFNMTGNTIPVVPVQQQTFNNGADGLWRWMPSINVDGEGNVAIGYSTSSTALNPGIRYAGRLALDPLNNMAQGEAVLFAAGGHQTSTSGRWGDYSAMFVDPLAPCTFWHTNEYYSVTSAAGWATRIGLFNVNPGVCTAAPVPPPAPPSPTPTSTPTTPTPTATPTATANPNPTASPTPPISAGPVTVTATAGTLGPTDYPTVQAAFASVNAGTHQGSVNVWVMANTTETVPAVLNASGTGSANYSSLLLLPNGTRTVSGAIAAGNPLIDLNGASNVRIDGYNQLTISNTTASATAGTSTIRLINGAQNDIIANCTILGSSTSAVGTAGGTVFFSTSTAVAGNNNNTVANNNIGPAGVNLPSKAVMSLGTAAKSNSSNVVNNNNIFDFFTAAASNTGISIQTNSDNWTISNNRIYQTAPRTFTGAAGVRYAGITVSAATGAFTISGNTIGFGAANGTGTTTITGTGTGLGNEVRGIDAPSTSLTAVTSIQGNIVSGINQTTNRNNTATTNLSAFIGIAVGNVGGVFDIGNVAGNTIGSLDGSSGIIVAESSTTANTIPVIGIFDFSFSDDLIANNNIGTITINSGGTGTVTGFRGILNAGTAGQAVTVVNNTIGGTTTNSITDTIVGSYAVYGIQNSGADLFANGNLIRNMTCNSNGAIVAMSGILMGTANAGVTEISRNTVHSLNVNAGAGAGAIYAIDMTMSSNSNVIERNFIHSITATSTATGYQLFGIVKRGAGAATVRNNMVRLGIDAAGAPITSGFSIIGIRDIAGGASSNFYYNSVYIGGSGVAAASNTYGLFSDFATTAVNTRNFKDNILWNARSNAAGVGKNYAIRLNGTAPNPAGLSSNYNDLFVSGTGGVVGQFNAVDQNTLANWQTATGQDANSISANPLFANPTGTAATVDLHIQNGSPAIAAGNPAAGTTNDFDGENRNPITPDVGADERAAFLANVAIGKTADAASVSAGSQIGFTVTIMNTSAGTATGLAVSDNLPAGTGINWTIDAGNSDPGWSVSGAPPNQSLTYSPTTLAGNSSTKAHVVSSTTGNSCGTYTNTASFRTSNDSSGIASASETVLCATVGITKTADAASVSAGSQIGFTVTLTNSTAGTAAGLSVTDTLPAGSGISWTIDAGNSDPGWSVSGAPPNQSLTYSPTTLGGNTSTKAHAVSNTTGNSCGTTYSNTASFTTSNDGSGSASASETVLCATVGITKTADAASVSAGSQIGFTVTLTNSTAGTATGLSLTDNLPAGTDINWTIDAGNTDPGWSVSGSPPNQSLTYSPTTLSGNTSTKAHVVSSTTGHSCGPTYNNTASFTTGNDGSGSASASETVLCATVGITKTADAASVSAGSQIGFTVTLTNSTGGTATGLSVTDNLPAGSGINWTIDAGNSDPGWSVSGAPPNQSLTYSPTTLAGNTSTKAHVVSNTTGNSCGTTYNNTASFTTSNDGSGSASASETVLCATVGITKTADAASVSAGSQIGFTVTLTNSTGGTATGLSLTDNLPPGSGINWTIDAGNSDPGWSVSGAPPNQSLTYSPTTLAGNTSTKAHAVSNTAGSSCGTTYNNTASFTTSNDGSGSASASETVLCATVGITKTADAASVSAGSQIGFTVTLTNSTAGTATGLSVTDNLPAGSGINWTIDAGNTSGGWSVSGAPPNQSLTYSPTTLAGNTSTKAHVVSNTAGSSCGTTYNNTASFITSNDGSGSASASETVLCATVAITKTADAPGVSAGSQIGFTVMLTNSTAGTATGLSVADNLPAGSGINWMIDAGNTSPGWSVSGAPPNQSLTYSPTTLAGNTSTKAHAVSNTAGSSCGTYNNTASFTTTNDGSGSASASGTVICPTPGFVIGDQNAAIGTHVTFWGAQWSKLNSLSGGPAPSAFKGFANAPNPNPPACGGTWKSDTGNSAGPPATVPAYITVIVSSSITQTGPVIFSGNIPKMVLIKTDPGYGPSPSSPGTGTVMGVICQ